MGRRKKKGTQKKRPNAKEYKLNGGPRDGEKMRLCFPPPRHLRLAFPEWCTYEYKGGLFQYIGDIRIPFDINAAYDGSNYVPLEEAL